LMMLSNTSFGLPVISGPSVAFSFKIVVWYAGARLNQRNVFMTRMISAAFQYRTLRV